MTNRINKENEGLLSHSILIALLDYNQETGIFTWKQKVSSRVEVGDAAGCLRTDKRIVIRINKIPYFAYRLAWFYVTNEWPKGIIDHIDRNPTNNAFANLRDTNQSVNMRNTGLQKNNTSGYKGITYLPKVRRWVVYVKVNGKTVTIGTYIAKVDAIYQLQKANERFGLTESLT